MSLRSTLIWTHAAPRSTDETVIDLTAEEDDDDEREVVEFALESGRTMRVRPGGLVIRHDRFADINPFERATAREVTSGNTIVVPNQAFVQEARAVLPVRILAQTRVQVYHAAVEAALPGIPGAIRARPRHGTSSSDFGALEHARLLKQPSWIGSMPSSTSCFPPDRLRPHAPQHWREFRAFMEVINVPPALADTIWREGIEPLRIDRRRAGARMAQAFVSVLVDPHGGLGSMPCGRQGRHRAAAKTGDGASRWRARRETARPARGSFTHDGCSCNASRMLSRRSRHAASIWMPWNAGCEAHPARI